LDVVSSVACPETDGLELEHWELWEQREPLPFPTVVERDTVDPGVT
jgi:hypothetical protein